MDNPLVKRRRKISAIPPDEDPSTSSESIVSLPSYFDEGMGGFIEEFEQSSSEDLNDFTEQQQQQLDSLTTRPALSTQKDSPASSSYSSRETSVSIVVSTELEEMEQSNGDLSRGWLKRTKFELFP
ncbi:uncharacterized protein [Euwallacea fornicatus]|uniref:uncharacterized protein n=1 Tax=Euwallacea fornicatus TaxID=995702 RepID=UPI00338D8B04